MISLAAQKVPATASTGSFGGAEFSNTRTGIPYYGRGGWLITQLRGQDVAVYLDNTDFLLTTTVNTPNWFTVPEQSASGSSSWVITVKSENSLSPSIPASIIGFLAVDIPVRKFAFVPEVDLGPYERALELLALRTNSENGGLTQGSAMKKLDELKNLPEDWDSYGADPISLHAIEVAKSVITSVMKAFGGIIGTVVQLTDIIPLADGGVQLEWVGPHDKLEVEISPNGTISHLYIAVFEDRRIYEEAEDDSLDDINGMIARLIHSQYNN